MQDEPSEPFFIQKHCMNTTLPGYEVVFVDTLPKKPKPKESFSWVLKLPAEGFPSKDSLKSHEFIPLSHNAQPSQTKPLSEFCSQDKAPLLPFNACLLEPDTRAEVADEASKERCLPEAALLKDDVAKEAEVKVGIRKMPPFHFNTKPKPRTQRTAPDFVSDTHEYSGPLLGEIRCFHGLTLGELADATRVAQHHLQNIEREQYESLPALVYLRGYLKSVARELGLDMQRVSQSYLDRMEQARS